MTFWKNSRVLLTGATGFLGKNLTPALLATGAELRTVSRNSPHGINSAHVDLSVFGYYDIFSGVDTVIHAAGNVGGIDYNLQHQTDIFFTNIQMFNTVLANIQKYQIPNLVLISSACVYAANAPVPTYEDSGYSDVPESSNSGYGWAKRYMELAAVKIPNLNVAIFRPSNMYGPHDKFDPQTAHVVAALITKCDHATDKLELWGTGKSTRALLYIEDAVSGIITLTPKGFNLGPINLCSREEISTYDLARLIVTMMHKNIEVVLNPDKPAGYARRLSATDKAIKLGFLPKYTLTKGIGKTIAFYRQVYGGSACAKF